MSEHDHSPPAKLQPHSVRCEKHGLRYNPNVDNGCARCRRESGEAPAAPSHTAPSHAAPGSGGGRAGADGVSLGAALGVALALIIGSGILLYLDDLRTWERVQELRASGRSTEGLTPEQHENLEQLERQVEEIFGETLEDDQDGDGED